MKYKRRIFVVFSIYISILFPVSCFVDAFDFYWEPEPTPGDGIWSEINERWFNLWIDQDVQIREEWPDMFPRTGDDVHLIRFGVYTVSVPISDNQDCRNLNVGISNETIIALEGGAPGNSGSQTLDVEGTLNVGLQSTPIFCDQTVVRGRGLWNGTNEGPNYVFIEARDTANFSTGVGGDEWIIEMTALDGRLYVDPIDFNFTLTDNGDGTYLLEYFAGINGINLLSIYCETRNNLVPGAPFPVPFLEVLPPEILTANFCDKGNCLEILFSLGTDQAGQLGHFDCNLILDGSFMSPSNIDVWLGAPFPESYCYWRNESILVAMMAHNAVPVVGSVIGIQGDILEGVIPFATNPADAQSAPLTAALDPVAPDMLISAPRFVSACDSILLLDATSSHGSGGRDYISGPTWSVTSSGSTSLAEINSALAAASSAQEDFVELDATLLGEGETYTFQVRATNFMNQEGIGTAVVERRANIPTLNIIGGPIHRVRRDSSLSLVTEVTGFCFDPLNIAEFRYEWRAGDNFTDEWFEENKEDLTVDVKNLWIPDRTLETFETYHFLVDLTITLTSNETITTSDEAFVTVELGPIWAIVADGDRVVDRRDQFDLDPRVSIDTSATNEPFEYQWACRRNTFPFIGRKCFDKPEAFLSGIRVRVPAEELSKGEYLFDLIVSKGDRNDSLSINVNIVETFESFDDDGVPFVQIAPLPVREWSTFESLELAGVIESAFTANASWSVTPASFDINDPANFIIQRADKLLLQPGLILGGIDYRFTLTASNVAGFGSATINIRGNEPPFSGICTAKRLEEPGFTEKMLRHRISCIHFEDDRKHVGTFYQWSYINPSTQRTVYIMLDRQLMATRYVLLPPAVTELVLIVTDIAGGEHRKVIPIEEVAPPAVVTDFTEFDTRVYAELDMPSRLGHSEEIAEVALTLLEELNTVRVAATNDTLFNGTRPICCEPQTWGENPQERIDRRRARQDIIDRISHGFHSFISPQAIWVFAELTAMSSTPSADTDELLMFSLQRFPFRFQSWLQLNEISDDTAQAFLHHVWNQLLSTQYVAFNPGEHIRLANAISDFIDLLSTSVGVGLTLDDGERFIEWLEEVGVKAVRRRLPQLDDEGLRRMEMFNVSVDLGLSVGTTIFQQVGTTDFEVVWNMVVLPTTLYLYEQSSEGIMAPTVFVQVINEEEENEPFEINNLPFPILLDIPRTILIDPNNRREPEDPSPVPECVWWFSPEKEPDHGSKPHHNSFWTSREVPDECTYSDRIDVPDGEGNTTELILDSFVCQCNHLTEFSMRTELNDFSGDSFDEQLSPGWFVFTGILILLLVLIIIGAIWLRIKRKREEELKNQIEFQSPLEFQSPSDRMGVDTPSDW